VDFASLDRLLPRLDLPAIEPLLDALVESPNRTTRRGLLDRLAAPPVDVGKALVARLADPRWYVQRNMLVLLETQPRVPAGFSAAGFLRHEDARVRREAIKLCLKIPAERSAALIAGFRDPDPQVYQLALVAAQMGCPAEAVAALARRLANETAESDQHPLALKLLGSTRSAEAVKVLLRVVDGGRSWYGRRQLAPKSRELLSALEALATGWGGHPGARRVLARARQSADADIREAAKEVAG
jgi:hypothetical protein